MTKIPAHLVARTRIYELMSEEGTWTYLMNFEVYTIPQLIERVESTGGTISPELKGLLEFHISRVQVFLDDRILESKKEYQL